MNQLKVLSDKIDDVTTVENIVKSFAKPGMSDQDRAEGPVEGDHPVSPSDNAAERAARRRLGGARSR